MVDPNKQLNERELMELAVRLAASSVPEDNAPRPLVGAVVARDGYVLATGFRGEGEPGRHAEEAALSKLKGAQAAGTTVYTTLEPCTMRGRQPCAQRLISRQVQRVVIGILDPNPDIRGQGEWMLEANGISIGKFEADLVRTIKAQNNEFIDYMLGLGVKISSPANGAVIEGDPVQMRGTYRVRPRTGDHVVAFTRKGFTYYPQAPIDWNPNSENRTWLCPRVSMWAFENKPTDYGLLVARVSDDLTVWLRNYTKVAEETRRDPGKAKWIGADMPTLPPGFEVLDSILVTRPAKGK